MVLADFPWWVSIIFGLGAFICLKFIFPSMFAENKTIKPLAEIGRNLAWLSIAFLIPAGVSFFRSFRKKMLLDSQKDINTIKSLSWREFEELIGEYYRRRGYTVQENDSAGADGGVDVTIINGGLTFLIQCKQWRSEKVGVNIIRENFGIVSAEGATGGIVITSGSFTPEAKKFGEGNGVELVDGSKLVEMIKEVNPQMTGSLETPETTGKGEGNDPTTCPKCGSNLVLRTAKKGPNAGNHFYGCSSYPNCKFTLNL